MFLSRIALDTKRRETMRALASPRLLHGAVEQSCSGGKQRKLWRIDWLGETCYLLVLSEKKPDFANLEKQFGYRNPAQKWETRDYGPLLSRLQSGQVWRFRLRANPVRSSFREKEETTGRGKVFAHVTHDQQKQWLRSRAEACGFALEEDAFDVVHTQWLKFSKYENGSQKVSLRTATFEGVLTIRSAERFKQALVSGIGRAKAYGCGLLTLARYGGDRDA